MIPVLLMALLITPFLLLACGIWRVWRWQEQEETQRDASCAQVYATADALHAAHAGVMRSITGQRSPLAIVAEPPEEEEEECEAEIMTLTPEQQQWGILRDSPDAKTNRYRLSLAELMGDAG